jgi:hypothetical protein
VHKEILSELPFCSATKYAGKPSVTDVPKCLNGSRLVTPVADAVEDPKEGNFDKISFSTVLVQQTHGEG